MALRLWKTAHRTPSDEHPLWVGNVAWLYVEERLKLLRFLRTDSDFINPLQQLADDTARLGQQRVQRPVTTGTAGALQWNGGVLLLYPPG